MATDDSDPSLRTAKFPKTRPADLTNKKGESGQEISLIANYIKILAAPKCNPSHRTHSRDLFFGDFLGDLFRYHCTFEPEVKLPVEAKVSLGSSDAHCLGGIAKDSS